MSWFLSLCNDIFILVLRLFVFSAVNLAFQLLTSKLCKFQLGLTMRNVTAGNTVKLQQAKAGKLLTHSSFNYLKRKEKHKLNQRTIKYTGRRRAQNTTGSLTPFKRYSTPICELQYVNCAIQRTSADAANQTIIHKWTLNKVSYTIITIYMVNANI